MKRSEYKQSALVSRSKGVIGRNFRDKALFRTFPVISVQK